MGDESTVHIVKIWAWQDAVPLWRLAVRGGTAQEALGTAMRDFERIRWEGPIDRVTIDRHVIGGGHE
jgi:hypothetical protein